MFVKFIDQDNDEEVYLNVYSIWKFSASPCNSTQTYVEDKRGTSYTFDGTPEQFHNLIMSLLPGGGIVANKDKSFYLGNCNP